MTPERWQQVDNLLGKALEQKPDGRAAFLDEACNGDAALRQEVESLLSAHAKAEGFTEAGPMRTPGKRTGVEKARDLTGRQVGHYQILARLGEGGMGVVYKARDTLLSRMVALKVLPPELVDDPERKRRFVQEAKAASSLNHPNIVTVYDVVADEGVDFIVMEYVAGQTLAELVAGRRLALDDALKYAVQIASALAAAHGAGVVHRDLKPGNIMVDGQGVVKVVDFGLAKLAARKVLGDLADAKATKTDTALATEEGTILGTVAYMSPEQAEGKPVDGRSDIFSFGALLYELVTRRRAFQADSSLAILTAILREDPKPASSVARGLPPELDRIVERCLRKDPERRFQGAADLKVMLEDLRGEISRGRPSVAAGSPARRRLWLAGLAAVLAVAGFAAWVIRSPKPPAQPGLRIVPLTSYRGSERNPSFSPDGTQVVFSWDGLSQDNTDIYVKLIASESQVCLTSHSNKDVSPVWSPDGRWIAFLRQVSPERALLLLIPPIGGREKQLGEIRDSWLDNWSHRSLAWSPDSQWVVAPGGGFSGEPFGLHAFSLESGEKHRLTTSSESQFGDRTPAFSPDGKTLVFARFTSGEVSELYLLSLSRDLTPTGEPVRLTFENRRTLAPTWSFDGSQIVFVSGRHHHPNLYRLSFLGATRPELLPIGSRGAYLFDPALSPQGDLGYSEVIFDVNIWGFELSGPEKRAGGPAPLISSTFLDHMPQFSPDGNKIAFVSFRSGDAEIWVCDADGSNPFQLTSLGGPDCTSPRWSPDSRKIAFVSTQAGRREIYVIDLAKGKTRRLTIGPANDEEPSWSQDGQWIYFGSNRNGESQVWKMPAAGGDALQVTSAGGNWPLESPDGRDVYFLRGEGSFQSLWKTPVDGGGKTMQVLDSVYAANYAVVKDGIYFIAQSREGRFAVHFLNFSTGKTSQLATIPKTVQWGFSVSPDERRILYTQVDHDGADLMRVENFR
jgi:Tol biopolymer transport system component/predicted Ser/Thr protein kinase